MRVRGLKYMIQLHYQAIIIVAPRAGAWIEIGHIAASGKSGLVAPRAGAWIEMTKLAATPSRFAVAPRAGAWIEIE